MCVRVKQDFHQSNEVSLCETDSDFSHWSRCKPEMSKAKWPLSGSSACLITVVPVSGSLPWARRGEKKHGEFTSMTWPYFSCTVNLLCFICSLLPSVKIKPDIWIRSSWDWLRAWLEHWGRASSSARLFPAREIKTRVRSAQLCVLFIFFSPGRN